jgi:hypothetical protein
LYLEANPSQANNSEDFSHAKKEHLRANQGLLDIKELRQIQSDIRRCVNFHPLLRLELIQKQLVNLLSTFLVINKDFTYIQGLDSIAVVLFTQLQGTSKSNLILPLLKQIYIMYLKPFIEKETHNLNFTYAALLTSRLVAFHEPVLFAHF